MQTDTPLAATGQHDMRYPGIASPLGSTAGTAMLAGPAHSTLAASADTMRMHAKIAFIERVLAYDQLREWFAHVQKTAADVELRRKQLHFELYSAFDNIPLESCVAHPADEILERVLRTPSDSPLFEWLQQFCLDPINPDFAASTLRCLGRQQKPGTVEWRAGLVRNALQADNVEIRDAAAQAAESWDDKEMINVLQSHQEPIPWLRQYITDVLSYMRR